MDIEVRDGTDGSVAVYFGRAVLSEFCLNLVLLNRQKLESFDVVEKRTGRRVTLHVNWPESGRRRRQSKKGKRNAPHLDDVRGRLTVSVSIIDFLMSPDEIETMEDLFLNLWSGNRPVMDHIDLQPFRPDGRGLTSP